MILVILSAAHPDRTAVLEFTYLYQIEIILIIIILNTCRELFLSL